MGGRQSVQRRDHLSYWADSAVALAQENEAAMEEAFEVRGDFALERERHRAVLCQALRSI